MGSNKRQRPVGVRLALQPGRGGGDEDRLKRLVVLVKTFQAFWDLLNDPPPEIGIGMVQDCSSTIASHAGTGLLPNMELLIQSLLENLDLTVLTGETAIQIAGTVLELSNYYVIRDHNFVEGIGLKCARCQGWSEEHPK